MPVIRRAVIDIGTNSVKLLVADVADDAVQPVFEDSEQTRLGAGFYTNNQLQPEAIARTAEAVALLAARARELSAVSTRAIATSAARESKNPEELVAAIERSSGLSVEIISGEQEADWAFQGVNTDPVLARQRLLLMDVGGGSTEFIVGQAPRAQFRKSFRLGTVRLMEALPPSDPPTAQELESSRQFVKEFLDREVRPELEPALQGISTGGAEHFPVQLVGTGGAATILARIEGDLTSYDRHLIEGTRLGVAQVHAHVERLWSLPLATRKTIPGLPKSRADVILSGVLIYEAVMEGFGLEELRVSTRGLRFAAVMPSQ